MAENLFQLQTAERMVRGAVVYGVGVGLINRISSIILRISLSTPAALATGALAAVSTVVVCQALDIEDADQPGLVLVGVIVGFGALYFAGVGLGLSAYGASLYAMMYLIGAAHGRWSAA